MKALLVALLLTFSAHAAAAVIDSVQLPAWLERGSTRVPLAPGMELRPGDRIVSGGNARVALKLSEGSIVKLGENGTLRIVELQPGRELFRAGLHILQGAFRFTTEALARDKKRDVRVRVSQVTIGVRGTDFWGRSRDEREIVCLIEGAIEVGAGGEQAVQLDKPLQFYQRDKGQSRPVAFVQADQLAQWAQETELQAGKVALRAGGRFSVELAAADNQAQALALQDRARAAGYPAEISEDNTVRIRHLASRADAEALASQLKGQFGAAEPIVRP